MVRACVLLCLLLILPAHAEVRMSVHADKSRIRLGEPWTVTLRIEDAVEPASSIALEALKQDFSILSANSSSESRKVRGRQLNVETLTLVLYPLKRGNLRLPALHYHGHKSAMPVVKVEAADASLQFSTTLDMPHPLVRQAVTLKLEIRDDGAMQWTVPHQLQGAGFYQRWLVEGQREETLEGRRYTVHSYAWEVMPLRDGVMEIGFPLLDAFRAGNRLRYPLPALQSYVAPVPAYVPVHVPIGRPQLAAQPLPEEIAVGRPYNRVITIQHGGLSEDGVRKLLTEAGESTALKYYPMSVEEVAGRQEQANSRALRITLPFVALQSGMLELPAISVPYYDLKYGRIETVSMPAASVLAYHTGWRLALHVMLGGLVAGMLAGGSYFAGRKLRCLRRKRLYLKHLRGLHSADALHRAILTNCTTAPVQTLQQWLGQVQVSDKAAERLPQLVQQLEQALYGKYENEIEIARLAAEFARVLHKMPCNRFSSLLV